MVLEEQKASFNNNNIQGYITKLCVTNRKLISKPENIFDGQKKIIYTHIYEDVIKCFKHNISKSILSAE